MGLMDKVKAQAEVGLAKANEADQGGPGEARPGRRPSTRPTACSTTSVPPSTPTGSDGVPRPPGRRRTPGDGAAGVRGRLRGPAAVTPGPDARRRDGARRQVAVVPHTHWDREWYEPFQTFRLKLVRLVDDLLDLLERDPSYRHFLLDGQLAVIDDYLEIRPENEDRLRALAAAGRLTVGPWYILMDEFLVSGETIVRNLQTGIRRGSAFGGVMEVGYLPDMFGHIAQMPQILAQAGLDHAVVWRGVPSAVDRTAFVWSAPDGSRVRAEYLVAGYGNGAALPEDAKALVRRLAALEEEIGLVPPPGAPMLLMNGTDHLRPQPWLGRVVAEANELQDDFDLAITSLPEYLAGRRHRGPGRVDGRAALGLPVQRAHGGRPPTGSTSSRPPPAPNGPSSGWPSR